jgi:hypothetical protein
MKALNLSSASRAIWLRQVWPKDHVAVYERSLSPEHPPRELELKRCKTSAEQSKILAGLEQKRLDEFMAWLQADGATAAALYMQAVGVSLRRNAGFRALPPQS